MIRPKIEKPRYFNAMTKAKSFLIDSFISSYPVDMLKLSKMYRWPILRENEVRHPSEAPNSILKGSYGVVLKVDDDYAIILKDSGMNDGCLNYTIAHEIAHVVLRHSEEFPQASTAERKILDKEAEYFAVNLMAPMVAIRYYGISNASQLIEQFGLSKSAAKFRFASYLNWKKRNVLSSDDLDILESIDDLPSLRSNLQFDNNDYAPSTYQFSFKAEQSPHRLLLLLLLFTQTTSGLISC